MGSLPSVARWQFAGSNVAVEGEGGGEGCASGEVTDGAEGGALAEAEVSTA